jgi:predicted N-acetyltransferase YhbS
MQETANTVNLVVQVISVRNTHRKYGIGTVLMQLAIEKAKEVGIPLALNSVPAAHNFYLRLGFRDLNHMDVDLAKWAPANSGYGIWRCYAMMMDEWCTTDRN